MSIECFMLPFFTMVVDYPATGNIHYLYRITTRRKEHKKKNPFGITKEIGISLEIFEQEKRNPGNEKKKGNI